MGDLHAVLRRVRRLLLRFRRPLSALLAGVAVLAVIDTVSPAAPARRPLVVAAHDLPAGSLVTASDVRVVEMTPGLTPTGSARAVSQVLGRTVAGPMRAGEAMTDRRTLGGSLIAGYPRGIVAAPVRMPDAAVVSLLEVGDRVDIYAALRDSPSADQVVTDVRVVALPRTADAEQGALVVLAMTSDQAALLAHAAATAPLSLTLLR